MRQLVLHVGSIKTGSTSAQHSFSDARAALAAHGLYYAAFSRNHGAIARLLHARQKHGPPGGGGAACRGNARLVADQAALQAAAAEAAAIGAGTYMISSEALLVIPPRKVELLRELVEETFPGFEVKVLIYIRHPLGYTVSRAQNQIKLAYETTGQVEAEGYNGELRRAVEAYRRVFGDAALTVRSYDEAVAGGRSVQNDMLAAIGHGDAAAEIVAGRSNESISMNAALVADIVNPALQARGIRIDTNVRGEKKQALSAIAGPRFALSQAAIDRIGPVAAGEAAWFEETFGIRLSAPRLIAREAIEAELMGEAERRAAAEAVLARLIEAAEGRPSRKAKRKGADRTRRATAGKGATAAGSGPGPKRGPAPGDGILARLVRRLNLRGS